MSVFEDPLALCEQKTKELRQRRSEIADEEAKLNTERYQIMHAISVAQHMLNRHSDSVVRSLFSVQTLDKAVKDLESGFDDIVLTTDKLLNIANSLDARSRGVSDSEAEDTDDDNDDDSQGSRKGPKVIR